MVRPSRLRNTRIAALISNQEFAVWHLAMRKYIHTDDGRTKRERAQDIHDGVDGLPDDIEAKETGVTVWENAVAPKKLPDSETIGAQGGTSPYTYGVKSGSLPAGLSLASSTGIISGTPITVIAATAAHYA